ncbi:hypothetical protein EBR03_07435, partial [bacterium]|nr:hypothetical protein [bacterium]
MFWFFRLSLLLSALSLGTPSLENHAHHFQNPSDVISVTVVLFPHLSDSFSEHETYKEESEELAKDFSTPAFNVKSNSIAHTHPTSELQTFLSAFWGRLQFLN